MLSFSSGAVRRMSAEGQILTLRGFQGAADLLLFTRALALLYERSDNAFSERVELRES